MRSLFFIGLVFLAIPAFALGQEAAGAEQEVREAISQYRQALIRGDADTLEQVWSDDYKFINVRGELLSKEQRLANIRSGATKLESIEGDETVSVRVYGDVALAMSRVYVTGQYGGKKSTGRVRSMHVWVKRDGRWQLVANQMTPEVAP